jgi:hypothetical protein
MSRQLDAELDAAAIRFSRDAAAQKQAAAQRAQARAEAAAARARASSRGEQDRSPTQRSAAVGHSSPGCSIAVPPLMDLSLRTLARHPDMIVDLRCTDEHQAVELLRLIMEAGRLDHRLACVFRDAGHDSIREAMEGLDLLAGVPTHNSVQKGCRRPTM